MIREVFHLDTSFISWFRFLRVLFCILWSFHSRRIDGIGDKGSGDTITVGVQMLFEAFLNMFLRSTCFIYEAFFLVKSQTSGLGTTLFKCWIIMVSGLWDVGLKEVFCIYKTVKNCISPGLRAIFENENTHFEI
jgi:hypothetical protein